MVAPVAEFDILASITRTRDERYLVMVSIAPRLAWSASSELEEVYVATEAEADEKCAALIEAALEKVRARGDKVSGIIGPRWDR